MSKERPNNKYTTAQVIQAIRETKGLVSLAAKRLNCHPDTVRRYAARYPTVAAALREERAAMTDVAELALYNAIQRGEPWAVTFYLKTQGKDRGYTERIDVIHSVREEAYRIAEQMGLDPDEVLAEAMAILGGKS